MRYIDPVLYSPNSLFSADLQRDPLSYSFNRPRYINFDGIFISTDNKKKLSLLKRLGEKDIKKRETKPHGSSKKIAQHGAGENGKKKSKRKKKN